MGGVEEENIDRVGENTASETTPPSPSLRPPLPSPSSRPPLTPPTVSSVGQNPIGQRYPAVKMAVHHLLQAQYITRGGFEQDYLLTTMGKAYLVNIIGIIVQKSDDELVNSYLLVDDGQDRIIVRAFDNKEIMKYAALGDMVNVIGQPRSYANEIYLVPETIKKLDNPKWLDVRRKELEILEKGIKKEKTISPISPDSSPTRQEEFGEIVTPQDKLILLIRELDKGDGVRMEDLLARTSPQTEKLIQHLLLRGEIFEIRPGRIKLLE